MFFQQTKKSGHATARNARFLVLLHGHFFHLLASRRSISLRLKEVAPKICFAQVYGTRTGAPAKWQTGKSQHANWPTTTTCTRHRQTQPQHAHWTPHQASPVTSGCGSTGTNPAAKPAAAVTKGQAGTCATQQEQNKTKTRCARQSRNALGTSPGHELGTRTQENASSPTYKRPHSRNIAKCKQHQRAPRTCAGKPMIVDEQPGGTGMNRRDSTLDVQEGHLGRRIWRHVCHGDKTTTVAEMPATSLDMPNPTSVMRSMTKTFRREMSQGGRAHVRAQVRNDYHLQELMQRRTPGHPHTTWETLTSEGDVEISGLTYETARRWGEQVSKTAEAHHKIRAKARAQCVQDAHHTEAASRTANENAGDDIRVSETERVCSCGMVLPTATALHTHIGLTHQERGQTHHAARQNGTFGRGAWFLWSVNRQRVEKAGTVSTPHNPGAQSGIGETMTQARACQALSSSGSMPTGATVAAYATEHERPVA